MSDALYSVGTWDEAEQSFTPQLGLSVPAFNITIHQLRQALKELRKLGYSAHRRRGKFHDYSCNDPMTLVERTDGAPEWWIREQWNRKDWWIRQHLLLIQD